MNWQEFQNTTSIHSYPLDDLIIHEMTENCVCNPKVDHILYTDVDLNKVAITYQVIHNAMDGRK